MLVQFYGNTRFQTDLKTVYCISAIFHLSGSKAKPTINKQTYNLVLVIRKACIRSNSKRINRFMTYIIMVKLEFNAQCPLFTQNVPILKTNKRIISLLFRGAKV